jgi:2'-5' RNA ligase
MRLFAAIPFDYNFEPELKELHTSLAKFKDILRWTAPENLHITLNFLGEVAPAQYPALRQKFLEACGDFKSVQITLDSTGAFPAHGPAHVLWLGFRDDKGILAGLAHRLALGFKELGFQGEEREFSPHLTYARVQRGANTKDLRAELAATKPRSRNLQVGRVLLMESKLTPDGPIYTIKEKASAKDSN